MSSLVRRLQRTLTRGKASGLIAFGTKLGVHQDVKSAKRKPRGSRRRTKPSTWRSSLSQGRLW